MNAPPEIPPHDPPHDPPRDSPTAKPPASAPASSDRLRLHLGGREARTGWKIVSLEDLPQVDFRGDCGDLSRFADGSVTDVYASHVYEHFPYSNNRLLNAWKEVHRVLAPGGRFMFSVPDLDRVCRLFVKPELTTEQRFYLMRVMYGGQTDANDFHYIGLNEEFALAYLAFAGFSTGRRVEGFGLFNDTSEQRFAGVPISLSIEAVK